MKERNKIPITVQLLLEKDNKVLLLKRKNTGYEDGKYCLPGGHVDSNEEIKSAMIRETKEEIKIDIKSEDLELYKILNRKIDKGGEYIDFIFKSRKWKGTIENGEKNKCDEIIWRDKNKLPENTLDYISEILKENTPIYIPYNWEKKY